LHRHRHHVPCERSIDVYHLACYVPLASPMDLTFCSMFSFHLPHPELGNLALSIRSLQYSHQNHDQFPLESASLSRVPTFHTPCGHTRRQVEWVVIKKSKVGLFGVPCSYVDLVERSPRLSRPFCIGSLLPRRIWCLSCTLRPQPAVGKALPRNTIDLDFDKLLRSGSPQYAKEHDRGTRRRLRHGPTPYT
jgi:hypothetical protein